MQLKRIIPITLYASGFFALAPACMGPSGMVAPAKGNGSTPTKPPSKTNDAMDARMMDAQMTTATHDAGNSMPAADGHPADAASVTADAGTSDTTVTVDAGTPMGTGMTATPGDGGQTNSSSSPTDPSRPTVAAGSPQLAGCPMFPPDNEWNRSVANDPVDSSSASYLGSMNVSTRFLHPDFGGAGQYGIPWTTVTASQARVPMQFDYSDDSDPGPYPFPPNAPIEGGSDGNGDRHVLVLDKDACKLYETFDSHPMGDGWHAGSGAIFDLRSNKLRPEHVTSADAAGLPILPGLIRRDEVQAGRIAHALRFTVQRTQRAYVHPATHFASTSTDPALPPMGLRVRLKKDFDVSAFGPTARVVLTALKEYGMFLADNGGDWFITGEANPDWNDDEIGELAKVPASAFEVVKAPQLLK